VEEGVPAAGRPQKGAITPPPNPPERASAWRSMPGRRTVNRCRRVCKRPGARRLARPRRKRILTIRQKIDNYRLIFISSESIASVTVTTFALAW